MKGFFWPYISYTCAVCSEKKKSGSCDFIVYPYISYTCVELCSCTGVWNIHPLWKNQDHCKVTAFYPKNLANKCIFIWSGKLKGTKNASNHLQSTMFTNLLFVSYNGHEKKYHFKGWFCHDLYGLPQAKTK